MSSPPPPPPPPPPPRKSQGCHAGRSHCGAACLGHPRKPYLTLDFEPATNAHKLLIMGALRSFPFQLCDPLQWAGWLAARPPASQPASQPAGQRGRVTADCVSGPCYSPAPTFAPPPPPPIRLIGQHESQSKGRRAASRRPATVNRAARQLPV